MFKKKTNSNKLLNKRLNLRSRFNIKLKSRFPKLYYFNRITLLKFLVTFIIYPTNKKIISLFCTSKGHFFYTITTLYEKLWKFYSLKRFSKFKKIHIRFIWSSFWNLKKKIKISQISLNNELFKVQYVRSIGSFAKIYQINKREKYATIILPSKKKYNLSIYQVVSKGPVLYFSKYKLKNNYAGYWRKLGKKANSRGVAMNPIDHPHGGRTNSIKLKKTPWGLPTSKNK